MCGALSAHWSVFIIAPLWCSYSSGSPDGSKAMYGLWSAVVASTRSLIREQQLTTAPYMALKPSPHTWLQSGQLLLQELREQQLLFLCLRGYRLNNG